MRFLRLLAVPLLASIWVGCGTAQSGVVQSGAVQSGFAQAAPLPLDQSPLATPSPFSLQPPARSHSFPLNSGTGTSLFTSKPVAPGFNQTIPPLHLRRLDRLASWPGSDILFQLAPLRTQRTVMMAHNDVCYTVRAYTFTRDHPASDATTMKDYYACSPAGSLHLKGAAPGAPR
jgi:hypothetical protein